MTNRVIMMNGLGEFFVRTEGSEIVLGPFGSGEEAASAIQTEELRCAVMDAEDSDRMDAFLTETIAAIDRGLAQRVAKLAAGSWAWACDEARWAFRDVYALDGAPILSHI